MSKSFILYLFFVYQDISLKWAPIMVVFLIVLIQRIRIIRDQKLINSVTSLDRGTKSERNLILQLLKHGIPPQTIFHDLYIVKSNSKFSQIDVVVATTQGIIVFEVKDYSGWIFGNGNHSYWTKVLAYGKEKYRFYNPIKQNINHIENLRKQLNQFKQIPFFSIIIFYGDCELKEIDFIPRGTFITKPHRVFEVLKRIRTTNQPAPYLNKREVVDTLRKAVNNGINKHNQEKHIKNINDMLGKDRIFK